MMIRLLALLLLPFGAACAATTEPPHASAPAAAPAFTSDRISVEVRGTGPDVVLIPGLSSHPEVWESTVAAVPGYRYHLVHVAGFGGKAPGANASGAVVEPVAEEIARYIREARLERPALVGHSLGGTWAMLVGARHPELASRVMVVDMLPFLGVMFGMPNATPETMRPIAEQIRRGMATSAGETRRRQVEQTIATMVRTESLRPAVVARTIASDPAVSAQAMYDLAMLDLRGELANIRGPMTVLWAMPPGVPITAEATEAGYRASYLNAPQAVVKRIPESWHFIMFDQPEVFQRELREFLGG
jgi:pimeloyl-ACP methyl ester carboxylesterase